VSKSFLVFSLWFFLLLPGSLRAIWSFNEDWLIFKWKKLLACRGARTFQAARTSPFDGRKCSYVVSLKALLCPLPVDAIHVGDSWAIYNWWVFVFFSFFSPENYMLVHFVVDIPTLVLILLIFDFCSWFFFVKVLFVFNFIIQS